MYHSFHDYNSFRGWIFEDWRLVFGQGRSIGENETKARGFRLSSMLETILVVKTYQLQKSHQMMINVKISFGLA